MFDENKNPVVILCGGRGMRLNEFTETTPKPLVRIGGMPILWHIMNLYASSGFKRFILCLGYKPERFEEFFDYYKANPLWNISFVDTGADTETGGRLRKIKERIDTPTFFATYGDNVSDVSIRELLASHRRLGCHATMTCVRANTTFGVVDLAGDGLIATYREKPRLDPYVNGGFFCFNREVFDYINDDEALEREPLQRLIAGRQLAPHLHDGFWACMDTFKDNQALNELWAQGKAPWKVW